MIRYENLDVLVVCAANQCRSRVAQSILQHGTQGLSAIKITSAGTRAFPGAPMCRDAHTFLSELGVNVDPTQPAIELTQEVLERADLVLAADTQVRADISTLDPRARTRTFTLRQAAAAATHLQQHDLVTRARAAALTGHVLVTADTERESTVLASALPRDTTQLGGWLAAELAAAQGLAPVVAGLDIADAHQSPRNVHHKVLAEIHASSVALVALFHSLLIQN